MYVNFVHLFLSSFAVIVYVQSSVYIVSDEIKYLHLFSIP
jgi:hypothetical protein